MTAQLLVNGLALGAAYALVAIGFVLVLTATGAVNFAQGEFVMAGGLLTALAGTYLPVPAIVLLPIAAIAMALMAVLVALVAWWPVRWHPATAVFISTIAVGIMLQNGALLVAGPEPRSGPALIGSGAWEWAGISFPRQSVAMIGVATVCIGSVWLLMHRTRLGARLRAAAQDPEMARCCGIPVFSLSLLAFALAGALCGVAGMLIANPFLVTPSIGPALLVKAYIAVTIGGWGSISGAALGAVLIALFEVCVAALVSHTAAVAMLYGVLLLVLAVRPHGFMGEAARDRV